MRWRLGIVLPLLFSTAAAAQPFTTALTGRVVSRGAPAAGVTVTATSKALQRERMTVTTKDGRYWLTALPPGDYEVTFSRAGLQTLTRRAVVELARVARADAALEPSEDEETITSTALTAGVSDTLSITSHYSDETLDRLPLPRGGGFLPIILAPGFLDGSRGFLDHAPLFGGSYVNEEAVEQATVIRAAAPVDVPAVVPFIHSRTRSGGEDFFATLRDTITNAGWIANAPSSYENDTRHLLEGTAGGRILPQRLWFFAGAWRGSAVFNDAREGRQAKLTAQLGAGHNLTAMRLDTLAGSSEVEETANTTLRYVAAAGPRITIEGVAAASETEVSEVDRGHPRFEQNSAFVKSTWVAGRHVLSAGGTLTRRDFGSDSTAFFINDRLLLDRWTVSLGLRHEADRITPRAAVSYDLRGDGRHAVLATAGDYRTGALHVRELTLGYASAIGNSGSARVDLIRRDRGVFAVEGVQADFVYTLFDRFHSGASYTAMRMDPRDGSRFPAHSLNLWAGIELPIGSHELGVTVLEILRSHVDRSIPAFAETELAVRYTLPVAGQQLTVAADVTNLFDRRYAAAMLGRAIRAWVRLRI